MKVLIISARVSGLTTAIGLKQKEFEIETFEASSFVPVLSATYLLM